MRWILSWRGFEPAGDTNVLTAPRSEAEQAQFERWCRATHLWYGPRLGLGMVTALLAWWPLDALVYAGMPEAQRAMAEFRLSLVAVLLGTSLLLPRLALVRRFPLHVVEGVTIFVSGLGGWHMSRVGNAAPFWFAFGYVVPVFTVIFLAPLPNRVFAATLLSAVAVGGFVLGPGDAFSATEMRAAVSYLAFTTILSIALGHGLYLLVRTGFLMRLRVDEQRERLAALTQHLEERVSEQTLQLRTLHRQSLEAGAEQRRVVARELHDGLGQELSSLRLLVGLGRDMSEEPGPRELFAELDGLVGRVQLSLRGVLEALRPRLLHDQSLVDALRNLLSDTERRWGLACGLEIGDVPSPLPPEVSAALFRIAQEALHNVLRHARASRVTLRLLCEGQALCLEVQDDGVGVPEDVPAGRGMEHIRERARELGGSAIWSVNRGTTLLVRLSLEAF